MKRSRTMTRKQAKRQRVKLKQRTHLDKNAIKRFAETTLFTPSKPLQDNGGSTPSEDVIYDANQNQA